MYPPACGCGGYGNDDAEPGTGYEGAKPPLNGSGIATLALENKIHSKKNIIS